MRGRKKDPNLPTEPEVMKVIRKDNPYVYEQMMRELNEMGIRFARNGDKRSASHCYVLVSMGNYFRKGDVKKSIGYLGVALKFNEYNHDANELLQAIREIEKQREHANTLLKHSRYQESFRAFESMRNVCPNAVFTNYFATIKMCKIAEEMKQYDLMYNEAKRGLKMYCLEYPYQGHDLCHLLGIACMKQEKWREAMEAFLEAIRRKEEMRGMLKRSMKICQKKITEMEGGTNEEDDINMERDPSEGVDLSKLPNLYTVLGLRDNCDYEVPKKVGERLLQSFNIDAIRPDRRKQAMEQRHHILVAVAVLSDIVKRMEYDYVLEDREKRRRAAEEEKKRREEQERQNHASRANFPQKNNNSQRGDWNGGANGEDPGGDPFDRSAHRKAKGMAEGWWKDQNKDGKWIDNATGQSMRPPSQQQQQQQQQQSNSGEYGKIIGGIVGDMSNSGQSQQTFDQIQNMINGGIGGNDLKNIVYQMKGTVNSQDLLQQRTNLDTVHDGQVFGAVDPRYQQFMYPQQQQQQQPQMPMNQFPNISQQPQQQNQSIFFPQQQSGGYQREMEDPQPAPTQNQQQQPANANDTDTGRESPDLLAEGNRDSNFQSSTNEAFSFRLETNTTTQAESQQQQQPAASANSGTTEGGQTSVEGAQQTFSFDNDPPAGSASSLGDNGRNAEETFVYEDEERWRKQFKTTKLPRTNQEFKKREAPVQIHEVLGFPKWVMKKVDETNYDHFW